MYVMPVFVEECTNVARVCAWVCAHLGVYTLCWVSLIGGVGYRVEQWGGKWDGMMDVANSCNWCCCSRLCWLLCV